ncbi:MAG: ribosomal-protein-alanine N-acetyltransferase [Clostridiales bacterium]|nr:ribosomal-protein-alanine N-acetyltransferase [Clostridiales bacterium]
MNDNLFIIKACENDCNDIFMVDQQYEHERYSLGLIKSELSIDTNIFYIAKFDNHPVAYIQYSIVADEAELIKIVVDRHYRSCGIGERLIRETLLELQSRGVKDVYLEVRESNNVAISLYKKIGFNKINERQNYYGDGVNAEILRLSLDVKN